jgi:hypothetical protein
MRDQVVRREVGLQPSLPELRKVGVHREAEDSTQDGVENRLGEGLLVGAIDSRCDVRAVIVRSGKRRIPSCLLVEARDELLEAGRFLLVSRSTHFRGNVVTKIWL